MDKKLGLLSLLVVNQAQPASSFLMMGLFSVQVYDFLRILCIKVVLEMVRWLFKAFFSISLRLICYTPIIFSQYLFCVIVKKNHYHTLQIIRVCIFDTTLFDLNLIDVQLKDISYLQLFTQNSFFICIAMLERISYISYNLYNSLRYVCYICIIVTALVVCGTQML